MILVYLLGRKFDRSMEEFNYLDKGDHGQHGL